MSTQIGGKKARDVPADDAIHANYAASLVLYDALKAGEKVDLDTVLIVQATRDESDGTVSAFKADEFTVREILDWVMLGAGRRAGAGEPEDFYSTLEEVAEEMLPED
jgi:hypothetical protein